MKRFKIGLYELSTQVILNSIALVLLTAAAVGLPAIWLIRNQLDRQAWTQVEQGRRAARALYAARQNELANLATLTAQRPTLHDLLRRAERAPLLNYLQTLQAGAELDLILICSAAGDVVAQTGRTSFEWLCQTGQAAGFYVIPGGGAGQVWLYAAHPVVDRSEQVIAGLTLDHQFSAEMRAETGLEHIIRIAGQATAAGSDNSFLAPPLFLPAADETAGRMTFTLAEQPYYAAAFPLSPASAATGQAVDLEAVVALPVANIAAAQQHLVWVMGGGIALVIAGGSLVGTLLARRISQPLAHLTTAAAALSRGDLDSPVVVETHVREVVLVAQALERARLDLQRTLTDLRYEKMWTDHLLTAMVEGIVTLDRHKRLTFFSPGAERITGWRREEVLGRSCDKVFQTVDAEEPFSRSIPPSGNRRKITVLLAAGEQATLAVTGALLNPPETKEASVALVFRDVSEEEVVHRLMGHFLANVAHEFRTPLSALAASAELLLDQAADLSSAELRDLLTSLHLGILSLQTLVDNLLESASIETGRFRVHSRPCSLAKIIAESIRLMQPLLDKRRQRLVLALTAAIPLVRVRADSRRTVQVLVNLLSNASKYGPDQAEITLGAAVNDGWARVTIADQGPGIAPAYRPALFQRFVHPDPTADKSQYGAGLGLSVVKAIVEAQGGQVGVEDQPGEGGVFWFTLPTEETA